LPLARICILRPIIPIETPIKMPHINASNIKIPPFCVAFISDIFTTPYIFISAFSSCIFRFFLFQDSLYSRSQDNNPTKSFAIFWLPEMSVITVVHISFLNMFIKYVCLIRCAYIRETLLVSIQKWLFSAISALGSEFQSSKYSMYSCG